jgi:hypothetical protein
VELYLYSPYSLHGIERENFAFFIEDSLPRVKWTVFVPRLRKFRSYNYTPPYDLIPFTKTTIPYA